MRRPTMLQDIVFCGDYSTCRSRAGRFAKIIQEMSVELMGYQEHSRAGSEVPRKFADIYYDHLFVWMARSPTFRGKHEEVNSLGMD